MKVQATARVQITVEFAVGGSVWGGDFPIEKVHEQAREAAIDILRRGLAIDGLTIQTGTKTKAKIVGEPSVVAILVEAQS
jgi:hypothetical protein